ncbi:hypothetical protein JCM14469_01260 [Desulfatiferula olefinivorans]
MTTRQRILREAEVIMADRGRSATIAEIASRAGIRDSVVYHYFKNKEDLLFSIAEERLRDIREKMDEQLLGLPDPVSRLRKLIVFRLYYLDRHRDYGRLLLFECRSNLAFYHHPAFDQARWFLIALGRIIEDGKRAGVFRQDLNPRLVRDAVFGMMDLVNLDQLLNDEAAPRTDFEPVLDLILPMITASPMSAPAAADKRRNILSAAEAVFAEKGYDSATIFDIASRAGVADGTIYDYFANKEDLLFRTLEDGFRPSVLKTGFQDHLNGDDAAPGRSDTLGALSRFIRLLFMIGLTQPSFARVFILHGIFNKAFYRSGAFGAFDRYMDRLGRIIDEGKKDGTLRPDTDPVLAGRLIVGAFSHMTLRRLVTEKKVAIDGAGEINAMVTLLTRALVRTDA